MSQRPWVASAGTVVSPSPVARRVFGGAAFGICYAVFSQACGGYDTNGIAHKGSPNAGGREQRQAASLTNGDAAQKPMIGRHDELVDSEEAGGVEPAFGSEGAASCPAGMVDVEGDYCTALVHNCLKPRGFDGKPTESANYYFCDEFAPGYAKCLGKTEHKHFCMDTYEYPNEKGAIPKVMVSWYEAQSLCAARGARLCGDDEWTLACEGPERLPYAYGWKRDAAACNIDHPWRKPDDAILASHDPADSEKIAAEVERLSAREPAGSRPACVSAYGVYDMVGNVDEWTENITLGGKPYRSVFKGGHWVKGARNRCRPQTESHDETTAYYAEGFRCCADAQGDNTGRNVDVP